MKKQKAKQFELDEISIADAKRVGQKLFDYRLTQDWLMLRLNKDWGISIRQSQLSEVLAGKRALGPKMRLVVWCCMQVIRQYEEFYGYCKKETEAEDDGS
ncbi:MAG: hypothetical protein E7667_03625 [Ruminococcaceae bacterium]|nr:hypothetical protein [Oscillospiraceae bacterium]